MRLKPLDEQVVVVFGASSGIGRETALRFARKGARVVIAARGREGLESVAEAIREEGGQVTVVQAEAADFEQVKGVAEAAVSAYGRLDAWVHVAAVTLYARFDNTTPDEFRRVVDVNLMGAAYGAMAALPHLKAEGRGALILVSSVEGKYALPLQSAYSASKHGIEGFAKALRLELQREGLPISVTTILPSTINTPLFDVARTKLGVKPKGFPPFYQPHLVADAILHAATHPEREIVVGGTGKALAVLNRISPRLADTAVARKAFWLQRSREVRPAEAPDNLYEPVPGHDQVEGSYSGRAWPFSIYTWLHLRRGVRYGLGALLLGGLAFAAIGPTTILTGVRTITAPVMTALPFRRRRARRGIVGRVASVGEGVRHAIRGLIPSSSAFIRLPSRAALGWPGGRRARQGPVERATGALEGLWRSMRGPILATLIGLLPWAVTGGFGRRRPLPAGPRRSRGHRQRSSRRHGAADRERPPTAQEHHGGGRGAHGRRAALGRGQEAAAAEMPASLPATGRGSPAQRQSGPPITREKLSWREPGGATEAPPVPSQAEGSRETVEEDLCEKGLAPPEDCQERPAEAKPEHLVTGRYLPSQAEGERDTVEEDLEER